MCIHRLGILLCASFFLVLTACDGSGSNDEDDENGVGEVNVSITGDGVDETLSGNAFFVSGTEPESGEQAFIVYLFSGEEYNQSSSFAFFGRSTERPSAGNYTFADADEADDTEIREQFVLVATVGASGNQPGTTYLSTSGSLDLETSTDDRVAGSIEVQGTGFTVENGQQVEKDVSITGSFEAPRRNQFVGSPFN